MEKDADSEEKAASASLELPKLENNDHHSHGSARTTILLAVTALGIIYGDLATSPLYTLNAIWPANEPAPSSEDIIGGLSAILYAILFLPVFKYAFVALEFGSAISTKGGSHDGGPFAIWSACFRKLDTDDSNRALTSFPTFSSKLPSSSEQPGILDRKIVQRLLFAWALFGVSLTISDGMLTPAVSVVSAIGGIAAAFPSVANATIPVSIAVILILFLAQIFGTKRIGNTFSPLLSLFLLTIGITGIINIASNASVMRAFDPSRAVMWFVRTKNFDNLAGVLLALTGCEAMFANLGQFSKSSIRLGYIAFVFPCTILSYLGQGARLIEDPTVINNIFFNSIPGGPGSTATSSQGLYWWTFTITLLATIIASQSLISGTFSLVQQLVNFGSMPKIKIIQSKENAGQVFVPLANFVLMCGTIGYAAGFGTGPGLTNAFGFSVATVFIVTTTFLAIAIVRIKALPLYVSYAFILFVGFLDSIFWVSALKKIPEGAYAPLAVGSFFTAFLLFWSEARALETKFDTTHRHRLTDLIRIEGITTDSSQIDDIEVESPATTGGARLRFPSVKSEIVSNPTNNSALVSIKTGNTLARLPILAFFHNESANLDGCPHSFDAFLQCYPALPQVVVFFSVIVLGKAYTDDEERIVVSRVRSFPGIYIIKYFVGYREVVNLGTMTQPIISAIKSLERSMGDDNVELRIGVVERAASSVVHIIPHYDIVAEKKGWRLTYYLRKFFLESVYASLQSDSTKGYVVNADSVLRIGVNAVL